MYLIRKYLVDLQKSALISVVVPTMNSEKYLQKCLSSIRDQKNTKVEIIVVDGFSTDATRNIVKSYDSILVTRRCNVSEARNIGLELSQGDFILFLDSDQVLSPCALSKCIQVCNNDKVDSVILPEESKGNSFLARCIAFEKQIKIIISGKELPRFFRIRTVRSLGGYDEELTFGEDLDLVIRLKRAGFSVGRTSERIFHFEPSSFSGVVLKYFSHGKNIGVLLNKYSQREVFSGYSLIFSRPLLFWRTGILDPIHGFGALFLRIIRGFSILFGLLNERFFYQD